MEPSSQPQEQEGQQNQQRHDPPKPMNPARHWLFAAKLAFDKIIVIELPLRQIQASSVSLFRPASLLIRAACGASFGVARDFCAAVGTDLRRHFLNAECGMRNAEFTNAECG